MNFRISGSLFILTLFLQVVQAQEFSISGKLIDSLTNAPLESASVFAETPKDSTLITYTITDKSGSFELKGRSAAAKVNLYVSMVGYKPLQRELAITDNNKIELGSLPLSPKVENLGEVTVEARRAPVTIKKDTLEFNVASFKTKKDATVEDLLRELPGVEVDGAGNITVNGKPVNQILVNGKPFFGNDPTIATRNLTKEIVDKIQVTDTKTKSEAFTNEAGDDQNKTINITIDKDKNKGVFGRIAAGGGTDERFEYAGLFNYFDNELQLSALGGGNNINSPGFSFGEIEKMFGNARSIRVNSNGNFNINGRSFGGGEGITNSRTTGLNYADNWSENTEASADYFYSAANTFEEELRNRETIFSDTRFFSNSSSTRVNNSDNHSANARFETKRDSTLFLEFRPHFEYSEGFSRFDREEETRNEEGELTNNSSTANNAFRNGRIFENSLTLTRRYGAKGGFIRLSANTNMRNTNTDTYLNSTTQIFGDEPETVIRNQFIDGDDAITQYDLKGAWRLPLVPKKFFLNLEYGFNHKLSEDRQSVFDFDESSQAFTAFNLSQSTDFSYRERTSRPEVGLQYRGENTNLSLDAAYIDRTLKNDDALREINFVKDFNALEISSSIWHKFSQRFSIWSGYRLRNSAPSVRQLSPYVDVSDPLNTITGNPNLNPVNHHNLYIGLNNFDWQTRTGFNSYINFNFSNDQIVPKTTVDENFVRNTTYANVDGNYSVNGNLRYSKNIELDTLRSLKYDLSFSINANRNINFNNDVQYASNTITYRPGIGLRFDWKELLEIRPEYRLSLTNNTFDLDLFEDREFLRHEVRLRTTTTFPRKLEWNNDINYAYNSNVAPGFQRSSLFWNSSLAYSVMGDSGLITLKAFDLLNQNTNSQRTATEDYIQDTQSTVLQRYFMLGFSYKFNSLGKKGEIRERNWFD